MNGSYAQKIKGGDTIPKENRVEYERVDEKGDKYRRILAKFNPKFLRGSDFEIEFIPMKAALVIGKIFVKEIDSMSSIDLYRWSTRKLWLTTGGEKGKRWTILDKKSNMEFAKFHMKQWRAGEFHLEPRQIVSRVKRVYEGVAREFSEPTAYAYNYYLYSGELGTLPPDNEDFTIENLKVMIEETPYNWKDADGELVKRSLVEHLFDVHKTKYLVGLLLNYLWESCIVAAEMKKQ